jgi:hypothetical protein
MEDLPIRKLYIDSRFKTADSVSDGHFKVSLNQSINLPEDTVCYVDDITIPYTFYTIEDYNQHLYVRRIYRNPITDAIETLVDNYITIPAQNYTGLTLNEAIKNALNTAFGGSTFNCTYSASNNEITIISNVVDYEFHIFTDLELKNNTAVGFPPAAWTGGFPTDTSYLEPKSLNKVLGITYFNNYRTSYQSGFVDLMNVHSIYISSPNLSSFKTLGARGEQNIIKKVPVNASYGYIIMDNVVAEHDYLDVSRRSFSSFEIRLHDAYGNTINTHGAPVSLSLIFVRRKDGMIT